MKTKIFLLLLLFGVSVCFSQTYLPVSKSSTVNFNIRNSGMETLGTLGGLEGEITWIPGNLKASSFDVSADVTGIQTGIDIRDKNLQAPEYLNSVKYPRINISSRQIIAAGQPGKFLAKATLTIKGISKEISIPFTVTTKAEGLLFAGEFRINRLDYKIGVGSLVLSDNLTVTLSIFAQKS